MANRPSGARDARRFCDCGCHVVEVVQAHEGDNEVGCMVAYGQLGSVGGNGGPGLWRCGGCLDEGECCVASDDLVSGRCQDAPETAFAAAHIDGQAAGGRQQVDEMGQVKLPEVIVQVR
jgi:hypothetical protein